MSAPHAFKRLVAVGGLLLVIPIALQLVSGTITPLDAGIRALVLFGGVLVARRLANLTPRPLLVVDTDAD
ncbi:MAG: hypothetical protein OEQ47_05320 [Acidimicrobiia bacterium]|jgi:hypothetical protein|nr:hypothetical protein [Acidimicrobiia bacterium]